MDQEYTELKQKIEAELERWLPQEPDAKFIEAVFGETGKLTDITSIKDLIVPARELCFRGGKRWRPLLMSLVCDTLGGGDKAIPLSPIVEFSHTASLIHDDIEDESDERRGKPSVHKMFGVDVGINAGSFFYFLASACIESCGFKDKELIYRLWMESMRKLHLGQSMDIHWHRYISYIPTMDQYYLMCSMKTGSLARLATGIGAHAAGAPQEAVRILGNVADKIGIGFQILDDVKNITTGVHGKKRGDDIVEGKKSLPVLLYLQKYPEKRELIFYYFYAAKTEGTSSPAIKEFIETLTPTGVFEEAEEKGRALLKESREFIHSHELINFSLNEKAYTLLDDFFNKIS